MSVTTAVIIVMAIAAGGLVAVVALGLYRIARPTSGRRIKLRWPMRSALLVIDMQEELLATGSARSYPPEDTEAVIRVIQRIVPVARSHDMPVVYIRQEFAGLSTKLAARLLYRGLGCAGRPGTRIDPRLPPDADNTFTKPADDAFSNPELERYLASLNVGELFLVGLEGAACVHRTACGARNRGYKVNFITDGILSAFPDRWRALLERHLEQGATALTSAEFESRPGSAASAATTADSLPAPPPAAAAQT